MVKWVTIFTPVLIVLGLVSGVYYYDCFGINILSFIDPGEAIFLFINLNFLLFAFLWIGFFLDELTPIPASEKTNVIPDITRPIYVKNKRKFGLLALVLLTFAIVPFKAPSISGAVLGGVVKISVLLYVSLLTIQYRHPLILKYWKEAFIVFISLFFCMAVSQFNAADKLANPEKEIVQIEFKDNSLLTSNKDSMYVGKSTNYIFFYIISKKSPFAIKSDEVKKITFRYK